MPDYGALEQICEQNPEAVEEFKQFLMYVGLSVTGTEHKVCFVGGYLAGRRSAFEDMVRR